MIRALLTLVLAVTALAAVGCSNSRSCTELCTLGQAGSCTSIRGNCANFCAALDGVQGPSGCGTQRNMYQACLDVGSNVCANDCTTEENALSTCVIGYCSAHSSDTNCATLAASF